MIANRTVAEGIEMNRHYVRHIDEHATIAAAGRRRAERDHTWLARFGRLFALIEGRKQKLFPTKGTLA